MRARRNTGLDILKGIACILVILIHRQLPGLVGEYCTALNRSAVAIFFIISGYYLYDSEQNRELVKIKKRALKLIKLLLVSLIFYFIWENALRIVGSGMQSSLNWICNDVMSKRTAYLVFVWDMDPFAGHLWYLFAIVRCYVLFYILIFYRGEKIIQFIPLITWCFIIVWEYTSNPMIIIRNGWFYGMSFFSTGYLWAKYEKRALRNKTYSIRHFMALVITGIILTVVERALIGNLQMYIGTILLSIGSFGIANTYYSYDTNNKLISLLKIIGQKYSTIIYIIHWAVTEVAVKFDKELSFSDNLLYKWISTMIVIIVSVLTSVIIERVMNKLRRTRGIYGSRS